MFQSNLGREVIIPVAQSNLGREVIIEGSNTDHPKPCDSCSLQTLPVMCSRSRGSSQSSVHGFETSSGGLWYHFSNPERIQSSSSSNAKAGHTGIGTSTKTRVQVTSQASSNKTSQRSRSSSRTRQNEVHFSSIPQLFSHPDDRFVVDSSGEPFRPTAEHEQTPKVVNVGSRNLVANCESGSSLPDFHKATVAMDSQLLTVPVQSGTESNVESDMDLPSQAPSLKSIDINPPPDVPPALVVTDALTPKRAPIAVEDQDGHNSPAGLNRTIFSRPAFRRRRFKEPELSEIGIQTGETIRLRQGMSFDQGSSAVTESTTKERLAPFGQTAANTSFERFANNSFEKRGHPASAVISAMLQKKQNEAARSSAENTEPSETAPSSGREMSIRGNAELPPQMINLNKERRRSFIDNQHHPYETRTHQEWRSSTRSQWEEGKLDENFNEVRSSGWTDASNQMQTDKKSTQSNGPHQDMDKLQYSRLSDQVFEEREVLVERNDYCDGSRPHINYAVQPMQKANAGGAKLGQLPLIGSPRKYIKNQDPQKVPHRVQDGMLSKSGQSNVISRETVEQLRKSVVAESRLPSTPSRKTGDGESEMPLLIDIKDLSMTDPVPKSSSLNQDVLYSTPKHETRISMKMKSPSSLWSSTFRGWERRNFASERGDNSPYKWQVPQIDTCKEPREPDVRSNENRSSNRGSTVRRHVPRGRIRDLARLFDGMSREAQRESEVLRGKSLPPPKHRTKCFRTHSLPRSQDYPSRGAEHLPRHERSQDYPSRGAEQLPRHERSQDYPSRGAEQLPRHEPPRDYALNKDPIPGDVLVPYPPTLGDNTESHTSTANQPNFSSTQRNSCSEPLGAAEAQRVGMEWTKPQRNDNEVSGDRDDATSTDSRVDLRRTSTPLGCHLAGDLANAFGRIPPIHYPENPAAYNAKRLESSPAGNLDSVTLPATSELCDKRCAESATHREPSEHHYAEPGVMRAPPPPQRLSVIHPNYGQHGYYEQPRRGQSDQQPYRMSVQVTSRAEPIYAKVHRVSANKIHPPVSYQGLCRPESVSTVASERPPESTETDKMNGEIDRMFEFVEDHDGLSTLGRETESENMSNVVKHGEYGIVRGDVVGQTPDFPTVHPHPLTPRGGPTSTKPSRPDQPLKYSISGYRDMQRAQRIGQISSDAPPRFSPLTAPTPGIGVSTYKSREGTVGEKVSTISRYSRPNTQPSALATSTPVNSPAGTGFSQGPPEVPNLDDSFVSTITTASHLHDAHEEYKRQIAKLNHQIRVQEEQIEMTLKVLALARKKQKSMQELSAQRTLLLARERLELLRCEVNRISALAAVRNPPPPVSRDLRGTMTISNITVHLNRSFCQRQYDQDTSYALLILLKCGAEVEATGPISLLAHQPIRIRQLTFAEHVQFSNLPVDFNVVVEVYAMKLPTAKQADQSCATNIANKCRNLLNPALTRPGRAAYRSDPQASEFARCGYIILNRDTVGANKFYLDEAEYPLEGIIEVYARCTTLPPAIEVDNRGFLTMYQTVSGMASWERYWAVLRRGMVYFWRYPDDESLEKRPVAFMDLSKCTNDEVVACNPEQCPRENSFSIDMLVTTTPSMMEKKRVLLSADSNELLHAWLQALNETLSVLRG